MKTIVIKGKPLSKDNHGIGRGRYSHYLRPEWKAYEHSIRMQVASQWKEPPLFGALRVDITFYFPNKTRIDLFNAPKSICDALGQKRKQGRITQHPIVWIDDKQIECGFLMVKYDKENPRTEITVTELGGKDVAV